MASPTIPTLHIAPASTDSPGIFNSRAFAWAAALTGWTSAVNTLAAWLAASTFQIANMDT